MAVKFAKKIRYNLTRSNFAKKVFTPRDKFAGGVARIFLPYLHLHGSWTTIRVDCDTDMD